MTKSKVLGAASAACVMASVAVAAPARVSSVTFARRFPAGAGDATRVFRPGDRALHAIVRLSGASSGDKVKAAWVMQDAGGVINYRFGEKTLTTSARIDTLHFATSVKRDWPRGKYRLDVFWNGKRARQEYFEVR